MAADRILVVDDEEHVRQALAAALESAGYAVGESSSVEAAIPMLEKDTGWALVSSPIC